jgi:hypothetical protein
LNAKHTDVSVVRRVDPKQIALRYKALESSRMHGGFEQLHTLTLLSTVEREKFFTAWDRLRPAAMKHGSSAKVFVATWNVGDAYPDPLEPLFAPCYDPVTSLATVDLIFFSAQECNFVAKQPGSTCQDEFFALVASALPGYVAVHRCSLWGIRVVLLVKCSALHLVSHVDVSKEATGLAHVMGNKGGIAIALRFGESSFCFVGSHLAAHLEHVKQRNSDFCEIIEGVSSNIGHKDMEIGTEFHHVFWCGDLNYRLDMDRNAVIQAAARGEWATLHAKDQLLGELAANNVFFLFEEPPPLFPPTYRYLRKTEGPVRQYDDFKGRIPSWCDRVLYKCLGHSTDRGAKRIAYNCCDELRSSDHSPVYSLFSLPIRTPYVHGSSRSVVKEIILWNVAAKDLRKADTFGLSDPFVCFSSNVLVRSDQRTKTKWKTLSPSWEGLFHLETHPFEAGYVRLQYLTFLLFDADVAGTCDSLGQAVLPLDIADSDTDGNGVNVVIPIIYCGLQSGTMTANVKIVLA